MDHNLSFYSVKYSLQLSKLRRKKQTQTVAGQSESDNSSDYRLEVIVTTVKLVVQPDLTAIRIYFTRWLILTTSLVQIVFYELPIHMNLYEWPTPNPAPKPTRHWGLDKSY